MKKLNAFQIKCFALFIMLLDHLFFAFPQVFPLWLHPLSRLVSPIFAYLMVEGFYHTRNRLKYNGRLFGWAIFMQAGNYLLNMTLASKDVSVHNNIFMTLAFGLAIINLFEYSKKKIGIPKILLIVIGILSIPVGLMFEGGQVVILVILVSYFFREKLKLQGIIYVTFSIILLFMSYVPYETIDMTINMLVYNCDFLFIFFFPFVLMYNGERGMNNKFSKYLFYVFYPMHLWLLAVSEFMLK